MALSVPFSALPGIGISSPSDNPPQSGIIQGSQFRWGGITSISSSTARANEQVAILNLPAIAAGASGTVTLTNTFVGAISTFQATVLNYADTGSTPDTGGAFVIAAVRRPSSGSVVIDYKNVGSATMSQAWSLAVMIFNG